MTDAEAREGAFEDALWIYCSRPDPEPFNAAAAFLGGEKWAADHIPHRGFTPGQKAELFNLYAQREMRELRAAEMGSGVHTELQATYETIEDFSTFNDRAKMLRVVRQINKLDRFVNGQRKPHRVKSCLRRMTKNGPMRDGHRVVEVVSQAEKTPHYRGVGRCGDLWVCPVCAPQATEKKRKDLREAVSAWRADGGQIVLITLTFPHTRADVLRKQWSGLGLARMKFAGCATMKKFREAAGWAGRVASREITYGINGWHPHSHELGFIAAGMTEETIDYWSGELAVAWQTACVESGLDRPSLEHGFRMSLTDVDDYIAKWGIDAELTKWHIKRGRINGDDEAEKRLNGYTPFDLLRIHAGTMEANPVLHITSGRAAALFSEYAHAVAGTAQLHYSRGLKKKLEDIGAEFEDDKREPGEDDDETIHGTLTAGDWFAIVGGDHQVEFLGLVHTIGWGFAQMFLHGWKDDSDRAAHCRIKAEVRNRGIAYLFKGGGN